ncbi:hypothetical protein J3E68DRAFT_219302 [Trichoderma sp. SZMC 28012]
MTFETRRKKGEEKMKQGKFDTRKVEEKRGEEKEERRKREEVDRTRRQKKGRRDKTDTNKNSPKGLGTVKVKHRTRCQIHQSSRSLCMDASPTRLMYEHVPRHATRSNAAFSTSVQSRRGDDLVHGMSLHDYGARRTPLFCLLLGRSIPVQNIRTSVMDTKECVWHCTYDGTADEVHKQGGHHDGCGSGREPAMNGNRMCQTTDLISVGPLSCPDISFANPYLQRNVATERVKRPQLQARIRRKRRRRDTPSRQRQHARGCRRQFVSAVYRI